MVAQNIPRLSNLNIIIPSLLLFLLSKLPSSKFSKCNEPTRNGNIKVGSIADKSCTNKKPSVVIPFAPVIGASNHKNLEPARSLIDQVMDKNKGICTNGSSSDLIGWQSKFLYSSFNFCLHY